MSQEIFVVDAFADEAFSGNPAAVCMLEQDRDDEWLQDIAAEMNLSETAFLMARGAGEWELRWFTPKIEVDLCGHATLASAHVLWQEIGVSFDTLRFHTRSGWLAASRSGESIGLDFPVDPPTAVSDSGLVSETLDIEAEYVGRGRDDLLVVLKNASDVKALKPDLNKVATLEARGVIVTARSDVPRYDFISRFFSPRAGIPEDPVTGSAHCTLGPYWGKRLGKSMLRGFQASARGGVVGVQLLGERVQLLGRAITILKGRLLV